MNKSQAQKMLAVARRAAARAHAPYSNFLVGAAVLDERGRIHPGCNVENASYSLTICAERAAVSRAVCSGAKEVKAVLVFTDTDWLTPPCGACLQVIAEFGKDPAIVLANRHATRNGRLSEFLPVRFRL